ncbi:tRNA lysidine(34) synthetase TilS [Paraburkholderia sp. BCC1884]|uniref:tRNA lysidine(34) synthetase TilS n=1 Tax=Paraburkholderia sp. BCC1884 TaxID=2562668 RepID=UPI00391F95DA
MRYWMRGLGMVAASSARLGDALRQLREVGAAGEGHALRIDHAGQALRSYRGSIYWEAGDSSEPADETRLTARATSELAWHGESIWRLPQWRGSFVFAAVDSADADKIAETPPNQAGSPAKLHDSVDSAATANDDDIDSATIPLSVLQRALLTARSRSGGERMRTGRSQNAPTRTLKNLFQERGIPAWKRDVPLLYLGDRLLFVPLLGVNRATIPDPMSPGEARVRISWREDLLIA